MNKFELAVWLLEKGWVESEYDIFTKEKKPDERFTLRYDGARFQKYSPVNGWRTIYFQKYNKLSISPEGKLSGLNVLITNRGNDGTHQIQS